MRSGDFRAYDRISSGEVVILAVMNRKDSDKRLSGFPKSAKPDIGGGPNLQALKAQDNSEDLLDWLGRWKPDRFDPAKVKFWSPLRRLKIALRD